MVDENVNCPRCNGYKVVTARLFADFRIMPTRIKQCNKWCRTSHIIGYILHLLFSGTLRGSTKFLIHNLSSYFHPSRRARAPTTPVTPYPLSHVTSIPSPLISRLRRSHNIITFYHFVPLYIYQLFVLLPSYSPLSFPSPPLFTPVFPATSPLTFPANFHHFSFNSHHFPINIYHLPLIYNQFLNPNILSPFSHHSLIILSSIPTLFTSAPTPIFPCFPTLYIFLQKSKGKSISSLTFRYNVL
jgi:hypothetical protein